MKLLLEYSDMLSRVRGHGREKTWQIESDLEKVKKGGRGERTEGNG